MRIGWIVQGSTDKAFLVGLKNRWCPDASMHELGFRGTELRPRKYAKACKEGRLKGIDVVVILTDSDSRDLNSVYKEESKHLSGLEHYTILGVAARNIECWICADADYVASRCGCDAGRLRVENPKDAFQRAVGITRDKKEPEIAELVREYPSLRPMLDNTSFSRFYDDVRDFAQLNGCSIPNEREN